MSDRTRDEIIDKVKKMVNLGNDNSAAPGERDNAMRMAFNWLKKYNLSMEDVEKAGKTEAQDEERAHSHFYFHHAWSRDVSNAIAQLFFCFYYFEGSTGAIKHNFIGKVTNVVTAIQIAQFLCESITREGRKLGKIEKDLGRSAGAFERNFAKGAALAIWSRCVKLRAEAEAENAPKASTGTALVLASLYATELAANKNYLEVRLGVKTHTQKDRQKQPGEGYSDGVRYGQNVHLGRQIGGADDSKKLK